MAPRQITKLIEETIEKMELQEHQFYAGEKIYFEENFEPFHLKKDIIWLPKMNWLSISTIWKKESLNICFPDAKGGFVNARFMRMTGHS